MAASPASPLRTPPTLPVARTLPAVLDRAAQDAARLADELLALHHELAAVAATNPTVRATRYRLEDAALTCRRASEEFRRT